MTEERITSRKNPTVQQVRKLLTSRKAREAAGLFVSDGTKLLKEAAVHCPGLETAFLCDGVEVELPENVRVARVSKEVTPSKRKPSNLYSSSQNLQLLSRKLITAFFP